MSFLKQIRELWDHLRGKGPAAAVALTINLAEARDNKPYFLEAGAVFVERCDGDLYARVNGPNGDGMNLRYVKKILYPVTSLYLTNSAQAGKSARLLLLPTGMDADPPTAGSLNDLLDVEIVSPADAEVLTYAAASALWKNKPPSLPSLDKCRVFNSADQSIPNNVITTLNFDSESFDTNDMHDPTVNNPRIYIKKAGYYLIVGVLTWAGNPTGLRAGYIFKNGTTIMLAYNTQNNVGAYSVYLAMVYFGWFTVGEYVQLRAWQNSGGALSVLGGDTNFAVTQMP